jgi:uncharacterized circularly permuted ATP-grasp superfamily protein
MSLFDNYDSSAFYDELIKSDGSARAGCNQTIKHLKKLGSVNLADRQHASDITIKDMGVSFTVYSDGKNIDRAWPLDIIPRIITLNEWQQIESGLIQRMLALNIFIDDIYHEKKILEDKVVPKSLILGSPNYRKECEQVNLKFNVWAHICGSDLVRDDSGDMFVLEDNLRVPSGVSYMLENRSVSKRINPDLFSNQNVIPVSDYPAQLLSMLEALSPRYIDAPQVVVLTPGIFNSAYFEHAYLAQQMGIELVEGSDLLVKENNNVYMRTVEGLKRVDVIYRRIDDLFIDPEVFNKTSVIGAPGLFRAWKAGKVALANAPGCGVADDKVVYSYMPDIIKYYLDEDPIIANVPTYRCNDKKHQEYVLSNLSKLVVKPANESGGYGMLVGPFASKSELSKFKSLIKENPRNYIAQPTLKLSTVPTFSNGGIAPRHVDLRPFSLMSKNNYVTPGGLTRVALREGSLVVNSSQGGGSKDTWIVDSK